jgi:SAM-dependent methyltransferase
MVPPEISGSGSVFAPGETFTKDLATIRQVALNEKSQSLTSERYQDDIISFVHQNSKSGKGIVEVGCFKGGLSAVLALVCKTFNWPFCVIDISEEHINYTKSLLTKLGFVNDVHFFVGPLERFALEVSLANASLLAVIDGCHHQANVIYDIAALYNLNKRCYAAVFHDFSLRYIGESQGPFATGVDVSIYECFGHTYPLQRIGIQFQEEKVAPDGSYFLKGGSEGAILVLPEKCSERIYAARCRALTADRDRAYNELNALLQSRSWRVFQKIKYPYTVAREALFKKRD